MSADTNTVWMFDWPRMDKISSTMTVLLTPFARKKLVMEMSEPSTWNRPSKAVTKLISTTLSVGVLISGI